MMIRWFALLLVCTLWGCAAREGAVVSSQEASVGVVSILPDTVGDFRYEGYRVYDTPDLGYSFRYRMPAVGYADVYVYPVPAGQLAYTHKDIVIAMTRGAVGEIQHYVDAGYYGGFEILSSGYMEGEHGDITTKVDGALQVKNLSSYTLIYLTENAGKLIKARITVNDNPHNRASASWDEFVDAIFGVVVSNIDEA